ncbi:tryptophan--tRNA ligase [Candidatus Acetothermia bacterium]|nr:tryptophan--tRNA ligase [Candidatus Acetothermia bacterium]
MGTNKPARVLSCIQPTGEMHIGNYFGAVANWIALQNEYRCVYGVVDLHAMTTSYAPLDLQKNTWQMVADLLACGIDPEKSILFVQSLVPEHAELCWILSCICSSGELTRMTQFKEKSQQQSEFVSAGLLFYPILQAADILAYRPQYVPVGKDQEQHLELCRNIAKRFNHRFGRDFFSEPNPLFTETPKIMSTVDPNKKMSKSLGAKHYIGIFEEEETIRYKIKTAVTDSGSLAPSEMSPGTQNLFEILEVCGKKDQSESLMDDYKAKKLKYAHLKQIVADALVELTSQLINNRKEFLTKPAKVKRIAYESSEKARIIAGETLCGVRSLVGLPKTSLPKRVIAGKSK